LGPSLSAADGEPMAERVGITRLRSLHQYRKLRRVLNQINGAEVAAAAAERFDRSVNPGKYQTRARFLGLSRS